MIRTDKWIYYDLEKTGCTFLEKKLKKISGHSTLYKTKKHSRPLTSYQVPKLMTIRHPYLWFFSLWSYGLDGNGSFAKKMKRRFPAIAKSAYQNKSKDCFSYFLDFALSCSSNIPRKQLTDSSLPFSCDVYTSRIITMLVPAEDLTSFVKRLGTDLSRDSIAQSLCSYLPEVLIRTSTLNQDFYRYANAGKLKFLDLKSNWSEQFPIDDKPRNISGLSSSNIGLEKLDKYLSNYHQELMDCKSQAAFYCLDMAENKLKERIIIG